ncbi:hypothetical protein [Burkholderia glumae]|uniref:hypothetical protein n=1 Tax=Burkholderia glumae TaxID=337 RepID=UPI0014647595|nr:hypothetical protein [Burkholderia glumae]QJP72919.1 hypothetical protein HJC54_22845 [Burkholderia glumae]
MEEKKWPFPDPQNVAVIADKRIVSRQDWIAYVSHDRDDGMWQFHTNRTEPLGENDASVVSLKNIADLDPSVLELASLPIGWHAWRASTDSGWQIAETRN